jgi:hypothetical protein
MGRACRTNGDIGHDKRYFGHQILRYEATWKNWLIIYTLLGIILYLDVVIKARIRNVSRFLFMRKGSVTET